MLLLLIVLVLLLIHLLICCIVGGFNLIFLQNFFYSLSRWQSVMGRFRVHILCRGTAFHD